MLDIQFTVSIIFCAIGIGMFLAMTIVFIVNLINGYFEISDNKVYIITAIIGLVIFYVSLFFVIKYYKLFNSPNVVHERLLDDLDKAEKELQKFYIDHPQFKEIKE
jgi:hypothetical protein